MNISRLKEAIENSPLRKSDIIAKSGVSKGTLDNVLKGIDPKVSTVEAITRVVGIKMSLLFDEGVEIKDNERSFNSNSDEIIKDLTSIIRKQEERIAELTDRLLGLK